MLEAERQFRKIIGYRDLATLVFAIERDHDRRRHTPTSRTRRTRRPLSSQPCNDHTPGPPPRIHGARDILQPVAVFADPSQLEQVLLNLVINGRDAIDETGSITMRTMNEAPTAFLHDHDLPSAWLQVTDTGSGIPDDVKPHIFDPFFSTKPAHTGTGLGLATIYGIVSQSGGSISVDIDSTVDVGTTMTVALPAAQTAAPSDATTPLPDHLRCGQVRSEQNRRADQRLHRVARIRLGHPNGDEARVGRPARPSDPGTPTDIIVCDCFPARAFSEL